MGLERRYDPLNTTPEESESHSVDGPTLDLLYELLRFMQPGIIVEAGTFQGSFALIARAACPDAKIYTADIVPYEQHEGIENVTFFWGDSNDMLKRYDIQGVDFAFIDSGPPAMLDDQWGTNVREMHYEAAKERMAPGGVIATHDTVSLEWQGAERIVGDASIQLNSGRGLSLRQI